MRKTTDSGMLPDDVIESAARTVQRVYRGHRTRRELRGCGITASARWIEALKEAQWQQLHRPPKSSKSPHDRCTPNHTRRNWQRAVSVAKRAGGDDDQISKLAHQSGDGPTYNTEIASNTPAKMMDLQYFLELVDLKHRHGSNLRAYHTLWRESSSNENFFYWLDHGEGKSVDVAHCPRDRLERQQVRYLTREERMNYLVTVDHAGLLRWAKNNELVWTNTACFKDSLRGVVNIEDDAPEFGDNTPTYEQVSVNTSSSTSPSCLSFSSREILDEIPSRREANPPTPNECKASKMKTIIHASPAAACRRALGKTRQKEDKWIFVADTSFRLYIGIKKSGAFQHSSFLRGARIAAAGIIKIRHGQLQSLAPTSGHYRPPAANFRAFHHALQQQGVDMSHVSLSKSYIMLAGIQGYTKTKGRISSVHKKVDDSKQKLHRTPDDHRFE